MPRMKQLYAWANPAFTRHAPVDHTWVTTYDNNTHTHPTIAAVVAAKEDYWYCWGSFHPQGTTPTHPDGSLGSQMGDLGLARCLVQSNADSSSVFQARGTILTYGIDGVCHQLANQVLYATGTGGMLTVAGATGYRASSAIYGTYGLQHSAWRSKIAACTAATTLPPPRGHRQRMSPGPGPRSDPGPNMIAAAPFNPPDEFETTVGNVLGAGQLGKVAQLLHLRAQFQVGAAAQAHTMVAPSADSLNARNQRFFEDAARLLKPDEFFAIFGMKPGETIELVLTDPAQASDAPAPTGTP